MQTAYGLYCLLIELWGMHSCQNLIKAKITGVHCFSTYFKWFVLHRSNWMLTFSPSSSSQEVCLFAKIFKLKALGSSDSAFSVFLLPFPFPWPFPDSWYPSCSPQGLSDNCWQARDILVSEKEAQPIENVSLPNSSLACSFPVIVFCPWN